jgi:hypothetical protein
VVVKVNIKDIRQRFFFLRKLLQERGNKNKGKIEKAWFPSVYCRAKLKSDAIMGVGGTGPEKPKDANHC